MEQVASAEKSLAEGVDFRGRFFQEVALMIISGLLVTVVEAESSGGLYLEYGEDVGPLVGGLSAADDSDGDGLTNEFEIGVTRYKLVNDPKSQADARAHAESQGAHLATITSFEERDAILSVIGDQIQSEKIWLGGLVSDMSVAHLGFGFYVKWDTSEPWDAPGFLPGPFASSPDMGAGVVWNIENLRAEIEPSEDLYPCLIEIGFYSDPDFADTDGDTLSDGDEVNLIGTFPSYNDSDADGLDDDDELGITGIFRYVSGPFTWSEAKADAASHGGRLLTLSNPWKREAVMEGFGLNALAWKSHTISRLLTE